MTAPDLEPIDHRGASIGCVARWPDGTLVAIAPSGRTRDCASRASAIWWLKETAAGCDPDQRRSYGWLANGLALLFLAGWCVFWVLFFAGFY